MKINNFCGFLFLSFFILAFLIQCTSSRPLPTSTIETKGIELREGVIIDTGHNLLFIMNMEGGIDAIELSKGERIWSTKLAAKPLMIIDNLLVCQVEPKDIHSRMEIIVMDVQKNGSIVYVDSVLLPEFVRVSIDETLESRFGTKTKIWKNEIYVFWNYFFQEEDGIWSPDSVAPITKSAKGIILINPSSRTILQLKDNEISSELKGALTNKYDLFSFSHPSEIQFPSADNSHFLKSIRFADDRTWEKYIWAIHETSTGKLIASITNHLSFTPYFVSNTSVLYVTTPFYRRGNPREPLKIRSKDLTNGAELWNFPIRETTYKGPFPDH